MNTVSYNLSMIFNALWVELTRVYYWDNLPFTLWDIATCGLIVSVMAVFLRRIVFFWKSDYSKL